MVGTGYVGLVTGTCLADFGNRVTCVDVDASRIEELEKGHVPFFEPLLADLVRRNCDAGRLQFTTDLESSAKQSRVIFIAVGTPENRDGAADLSAILRVAEAIGRAMDG